jgi:hypothetical protein
MLLAHRFGGCYGEGVALLLYVLIALGVIYALTLIFKALRFVAVTINRRITARADGYSIDGEWRRVAPMTGYSPCRR